MLCFQIFATDFRIAAGNQRKSIENAFAFILWLLDSEGFCWSQIFRAFCIVALVTNQRRYKGLNHMFFPLHGLLILTDHQHFISQDKIAFDTDKKNRIGTKNVFSDGTLNLTKIHAVHTTISFRFFSCYS